MSNKKPKSEPRQQSIPAFTEAEMPVINIAMKIEAIPSLGAWTKRAALMWARQVAVSDSAKLQKAVEELLQELKDENK